MQEVLADLVHPILHYGLALKERLERGAAPSLDLEQATLKRMLQTELEAAQYPEYGGETRGQGFDTAVEGRSAGGVDMFLGARYALTCWLDELFIVHSPWSTAWNERKLEVALYGSNDRAWRFWEQARLAETRPTTDALEVYFLCVMLGFRGELGEESERLRAWCKAVQGRLTHMGEEWPHPPELDPPTDVPPLHGRDSFRHALYWTCVLLLLLIPLGTFIVMQQVTD
jgi:type VI secretion system protein ImpK